MIRLALGLTMILALSVGLTRAAFDGPSPMIAAPPLSLLPGSALPLDAECVWPIYMSYYSSCSLLRVEGRFWLSYSYRDHRIISLSMPLHVRAGDLICAWGRPAAVSYGWMIVLYWQGRSAIFFPREDFGPGSLSHWIDFGERPYRAGSWRGFRG